MLRSVRFSDLFGDFTLFENQNVINKIYKLNIKFEFDDVAVLHDVGFSLGSEFAGFFDGFFGAVFF